MYMVRLVSIIKRLYNDYNLSLSKSLSYILEIITLTFFLTQINTNHASRNVTIKLIAKQR